MSVASEPRIDWCERDACIGLGYGAKRLVDGVCSSCGEPPPTTAELPAVCPCGRAFELTAVLRAHIALNAKCRERAERLVKGARS